MSEETSNTALRCIRVLECLFENDFQGKTESTISKETGISLTTVWRMLNTLKVAGWVVDVPVSGSKAKVWKVNGSVLIGIANKYDESTLRRIQAIEKEHLEATGKELRR